MYSYKYIGLSLTGSMSLTDNIISQCVDCTLLTKEIGNSGICDNVCYSCSY